MLPEYPLLPSTHLNRQRDVVRPTSGLHGCDIASQRADELDLACLQVAKERGQRKLRAVDLGCGWGAQGRRLAELGVETHLYDVIEQGGFTRDGQQRSFAGELRFHRVDLSCPLSSDTFPRNLDIVYSQRFIHFLTFRQVLRLLEHLTQVSSEGALAFLSASGLGSELGDGYSHARCHFERRYAKLEASQAQKHHIHAPVCLYTQEDLVALTRRVGWRTLRVFESSFGNIKGIFEVGS
ncbi:MAG: class I SAM-dependent methyltransferase [Myxococcota bacterium]